MLSYEEVQDATSRDENMPTLLLANGFSQAWDPHIFNYQNLLDVANFGDRDALIRSLFQRLDTYDFETIMGQLVSASVVCEVYGIAAEEIDQIRADQEALKNSLISAISNTHPNRPHNVAEEQYISVRAFISEYQEIFTVNYDLLLYWARNMRDLAPANYESDDGFRVRRRWQGYGTNQNVHFLHGGIHIYDTGVHIEKHVFRDDGETIVEQVRSNLEIGKFPLFVSEPSHEAKLKKIEHNPYLSYCFRELKKLTGSLVIYGHSFDETDKHIFDQIKNSNVRNVYISIYGDENSDANVRTKANARAFLERPSIEVEFFIAETAPIWHSDEA